MGKLLGKFQIVAAILFVSAGLLLVAFSLPFTGLRALSVQTGSMQPAIPPGSLVLVHRVSPSSLKQGDVITYKSKTNPGTTVTHRVVSRVGLANGPKQTILKGDANHAVDAPVYDNQVVGKVFGSVPFVGRALDSLKTPLGLTLFVYLPAIWIFVSETRLMVRRLAKLELKERQVKLQRQAHLGGGLPVVLALVSGVSLAAPTLATDTLNSEAILTGNVISTTDETPPPSDSHISIDRVDFPEKKRKHGRHGHWQWYYDPTVITVYSSERWKDVDVEGWTLSDSDGVLYTLKNKHKRYWKHGHWHWHEQWKGHKLEIKLRQPGVLDWRGDFLQLKNDQGDPVDAISWGSDTSQLDPSIQNVKPGSLLVRIRHVDTDTAADWRVKHGWW